MTCVLPRNYLNQVTGGLEHSRLQELQDGEPRLLNFWDTLSEVKALPCDEN